jgi:hypothetical protein
MKKSPKKVCSRIKNPSKTSKNNPATGKASVQKKKSGVKVAASKVPISKPLIKMAKQSGKAR